MCGCVVIYLFLALFIFFHFVIAHFPPWHYIHLSLIYAVMFYTVICFKETKSSLKRWLHFRSNNCNSILAIRNHTKGNTRPSYVGLQFGNCRPKGPTLHWYYFFTFIFCWTSLIRLYIFMLLLSVLLLFSKAL